MDFNKPYYPQRNDLNQGECLLLGSFKARGYGVYILLLQEINKSYYMKINDEVIAMLGRKWDVSVALISDIIYKAMGWGLFDYKSFKEKGILTSEEIQINHFTAIKTRKDIVIDKSLLIASIIPKLRKIKVYQSFFEEKQSNSDREKETKPNNTKEEEIEKESNQAEPFDNSLSLEKFKRIYPEKCVGLDDNFKVPDFVNLELVIEKIEESPEFLKVLNNLNLTWMCKPVKYEKIIANYYKDKKTGEVREETGGGEYADLV